MEVIHRYKRAITIHVSKGEKVFATISFPTFVKSVIEITETKEESFTKAIVSPTSVGMLF